MPQDLISVRTDDSVTRERAESSETTVLDVLESTEITEPREVGVSEDLF